jgi:dephospho-CoA kinase
MIVGLTGGIASGKSTVVKTFVRLGIPEVDADIVARQIVEVGSKGWQLIRAAFGQEYINEDQTINRSKLATLVFSDRSARSDLDGLMLPLITEESERQLQKLVAEYPIIVYNAALICEMGHVDKYRPLIVVSCPLKTQLARLMKRNSLSEEAAMKIINSQTPTEEKVKLADFVVDTSNSIDESIAQTEKIIDQLIVLNTKQDHSKMKSMP